MKKKILITGGNGYIAKSIYKVYSSTYDITSINRNDFNLENSIDTHTWLKDRFFDVVIHTAIQGGSRLQQETNCMIEQNLKMYYNLLENRKSFNKLINLGSGAEFYCIDTPYSTSKKIIAKSIDCHDNFYNLRIYGVFDENELSTRFIKSNLIRYINNQEILLYHNKYMDFIHMQDFLLILNHYILNNNLPKHIDCIYKSAYSLLDIANIINQLSGYRVNISIANNEIMNNYTGNFFDLGLKLNSIEERIFQTYNILKESL